MKKRKVNVILMISEKKQMTGIKWLLHYHEKKMNEYKGFVKNIKQEKRKWLIERSEGNMLLASVGSVSPVSLKGSYNSYYSQCTSDVI